MPNPNIVFDHVHLLSKDPQATANWYVEGQGRGIQRGTAGQQPDHATGVYQRAGRRQCGIVESQGHGVNAARRRGMRYATRRQRREQ